MRKTTSIRWKLAKALLTKEERNLMRIGCAVGIKKYKEVDMTDELEVGDEVFVKATIDEIMHGSIICKNSHGYYYTVDREDLAIQPEQIERGMSYD